MIKPHPAAASAPFPTFASIGPLEYSRCLQANQPRLSASPPFETIAIVRVSGCALRESRICIDRTPRRRGLADVPYSTPLARSNRSAPTPKHASSHQIPRPSCAPIQMRFCVSNDSKSGRYRFKILAKPLTFLSTCRRPRLQPAVVRRMCRQARPQYFSKICRFLSSSRSSRKQIEKRSERANTKACVSEATGGSGDSLISVKMVRITLARGGASATSNFFHLLANIPGRCSPPRHQVHAVDVGSQTAGGMY